MKPARIGAYGAACAALVAVFALYSAPEIMIPVSEFIWACFGR